MELNLNFAKLEKKLPIGIRTHLDSMLFPMATNFLSRNKDNLETVDYSITTLVKLSKNRIIKIPTIKTKNLEKTLKKELEKIIPHYTKIAEIENLLYIELQIGLEIKTKLKSKTKTEFLIPNFLTLTIYILTSFV